jgi:3-phosphoshikimate 1-carboxyvinyltransferase
MLGDLGVDVGDEPSGFGIEGVPTFRRRSLRVPSDASSAAYLWSAAVATGGSVAVKGEFFRWPQADLRLLDILEEFGARVDRTAREVRVSGRPTRSVRADFTDSPDLFPLVGVLAALVEGRESVLSGASHLVLKESDRRAGTARLVRALGARAELRDGKLRIRGTNHPRPIRAEHLTDHRMVMSAAVGALAASGPSRVGDAGAVSKSFPEFWNVLDSVRSGGSGPR